MKIVEGAVRALAAEHVELVLGDSGAERGTRSDPPVHLGLGPRPGVCVWDDVARRQLRTTQQTLGCGLG